MIRVFNRASFKLWLDVLMLAAAFPIAMGLRLGEISLVTLPHLAAAVGIAWPLVLGLRLNKGLWRYTSLADLVQITKACTVFAALFYVLLFAWFRLENIPRSVPFIHVGVAVALLCMPRIAYRLWQQRQRYLKLALNPNRVPVLLVGTTQRAELFLRETAIRPTTSYRIVGVLDRDASLQGQTIHGVPVNAPLSHLPQVVEALTESHLRPHKIILADDSVEGEALAALIAQADMIGIPVAKLPRHTSVSSNSGGLVTQAIAIEDILGRAQNVNDISGVRACMNGKSILITGAGGSIGSELARQIASFSPSRLTLLDHSEFHLYQIHRELQAVKGLYALLSDVRDEDALRTAFVAAEPDMVFHAAAIKHVPLAEENVCETVLTNVLGTCNVAQACRTHGVKSLVLISTDKAVNPTNIMGATKRLAEKMVAAAGWATIVRFGNVLGSTGSVVPLFEEQIACGGPVTVTHPQMERYFMTVREAVELVLQAASLRSPGTYILDMGTPVKIIDLARQMIRLAGLKPDVEIPIEFTGLRPGEKLTEELFYPEETPELTPKQGIRRITQSTTSPDIGALVEHARRRDTKETIHTLCALMPEYRPM